MVFVSSKKSNLNPDCQTRISKNMLGYLPRNRGILGKYALVDPEKCHQSDQDRADVLNGDGPFPKWDEDDEGANQERGLREFNSDIERDKG